MKVCSVCQRCYEDAVLFCTEENHEPPVEKRPGSREIVANYRLDFLLESNETEETYEATDIAINQPCIFKILIADSASDERKLSRQFLNEAQSFAAVSHPNVVRVYDFGVLAGDEFYVVTEAVGGQTLRNCLKNVGSPSEVTAIQITRQTAEGLEAIHAAGITHRNISPENIILASDAENRLLVKIQNFDFGGVKQQIKTSGKLNSENILNELKYLSPEQCAGQGTDARTDIYSLGIVLYEMLNGQPPFDAPDAAGLIHKQINEQPPPAKIATFDIRALLTHTLTDSLQKIPRIRLKTANTFARQLRHIEQLITHSPTPPPVVTVVPPPTKKIPTVLPKLQKSEAAAANTNNSLKAEVKPIAPLKQKKIADLEIVEVVTETSKESAVVSVSPEDSAIESIPIEDALKVQDEPKIKDEPSIEPEPILVEEAETSFVEEEAGLNFVEEVETVSTASESVLIEWEQPDDIRTELEALEAIEKEFQEPDVQPEPILAEEAETNFVERVEESFVEKSEDSFVEEVEESFAEKVEASPISPAAETVPVDWEQPDDIPSEMEVLEAREKEFDEPELTSESVFLEEETVVPINESEPIADISIEDELSVQSEPIFVEAAETNFVEEAETISVLTDSEPVLIEWKQPDHIPSEAEVLEAKEKEFDEGEFASELALLDEEETVVPIIESETFVETEPIVIEVEKPQAQAAESSIFSYGDYNNYDDYSDYNEDNDSGGFLSSNRSLFISMGVLTLLLSGFISVMVNTQVELPPQQTTAQSAPISKSLPKSEEPIAIPKSETPAAEKPNESVSNDEATITDNSDTTDSVKPVSPEKPISSTSKRSNQTSKETPDSITKVKQNKSSSKETTSNNKQNTSPDKKQPNEKQLPKTTKPDIFSRPRIVKNAGL